MTDKPTSRYYVIIPQEGYRLMNQDGASALEITSDMMRDHGTPKTAIIAIPGITKKQLIADLNDAIEYAKKDLP
jgi:hypothetical protein